MPTLLYVFIFIALRALRFEARFEVFAGITAAAGWTILAIYAVYASGGMEMITRNYIYYMTSNSILIGTELGKIISILTVTAILAVAISRARSLLTRDVAERAAKLEKFTKSEKVRARTDTAAYEMAVAQGYRADAERRGQRRVEGLENTGNLIVLAP